MKYIYAIDETCRFAINNDTKSFTCGVLINGNEFALKQAYQKVYEELGFPAPTPTTIDGLLKTTDNIDDNARFHFNRLTDEQREICKKHLLPFVQRVYVSKDKPVLFANNQNWWLIAITVIIREFLRDLKLEKDDEVEIWIDNRNEKVWGIEDDENNIEFKDYHNIIKQQIVNNVKDYVQYRDKLKIMFRSDTSSFFINLADIVCGFVRKDKCVLNDRIEECSCKEFNSGLDPISCKSKNPLLALGIIYQEVDSDKYDNISHIGDILARLRNDKDDYEMAWDMFHDFLKSEINERRISSKLVGLSDFVEMFFKEFDNAAKLRISASRCLELMVLFVEYYSHIGSTDNPFKRDNFVGILKHCDKDTETRTLRKWEKLVSYTLRECQIYFNSYNFVAAKDSLEQVWEKHEKLMSVLGDILYEKDEPTAALIGSLAQSYAFEGNNDEAVEYFDMSKNYAIKSTAITNSYLFAIYHSNGDVEKCREYFQMVTHKTPEDYYQKGKFDETWVLLLYCKLRALELYKNGTTVLSAIDLESLKNYNSEYPFPLVMKWEGVALCLENKDGNISKAKKYFTDAIANLLAKNNGFAIRTLALPIMQCYSSMDNQNPYHARYNTYLNELKAQSSSFAAYVDNKMPILNEVRNDRDIWQRALMLPFYYS